MKGPFRYALRRALRHVPLNEPLEECPLARRPHVQTGSPGPTTWPTNRIDHRFFLLEGRWSIALKSFFFVFSWQRRLPNFLSSFAT